MKRQICPHFFHNGRWIFFRSKLLQTYFCRVLIFPLRSEKLHSFWSIQELSAKTMKFSHGKRMFAGKKTIVVASATWRQIFRGEKNRRLIAKCLENNQKINKTYIYTCKRNWTNKDASLKYTLPWLKFVKNHSFSNETKQKRCIFFPKVCPLFIKWV